MKKNETKRLGDVPDTSWRPRFRWENIFLCLGNVIKVDKMLHHIKMYDHCYERLDTF